MYIRFCGNGYLGFRPTAAHFEKRKSKQNAHAPPLGASPRLGMPSLRHCSVGPLHNACVRPAWLTGRRNQRPPRGGLIADLVLGDRVSPVGAGLLAKAVIQLDRDWIGCRHHEQARSHTGSVTIYRFAATANPVGAKLARDGGESADISLGYTAVFASKPAPTRGR